MILNCSPWRAVFVKRFNGWLKHHAIVMHYFTNDVEFLRLRDSIARMWWVVIGLYASMGLLLLGFVSSAWFAAPANIVGAIGGTVFGILGIRSLIAPWYIMRNTQYFMVDYLRSEGIDARLPRFWGNLANHRGDITEKAEIVGIRFMAFILAGPKIVFQTQRFMNQVVAAKGLSDVDVPTAIEPVSLWQRLRRKSQAKPTIDAPTGDVQALPNENPTIDPIPASKTVAAEPIEVVVETKVSPPAYNATPATRTGSEYPETPDRAMAWMNVLTIGGILLGAIYLTWERTSLTAGLFAVNNERILLAYAGGTAIAFAIFALIAAHNPRRKLKYIGTGFLAAIASLPVSFALMAAGGFEPLIDMTYFLVGAIGATFYGLLLATTPRGALGFHPAKLVVPLVCAAIVFLAHGVFTS